MCKYDGFYHPAEVSRHYDTNDDITTGLVRKIVFSVIYTSKHAPKYVSKVNKLIYKYKFSYRWVKYRKNKDTHYKYSWEFVSTIIKLDI